jgi:alginate O-acetyltransferase complex protein AlgI
LPRPFRIGMTFVLVLGSWVWFRAESLPAALAYFAAMSGGGSTSETTALLAAQLFAPAKVAIMAIAALFLCAPFQAHDWSEDVNYRKAILVPLAFASAILAMFSQSANPFLYFQF